MLVWPLALAPIAAFGALRLGAHARYRRLAREQTAIVNEHAGFFDPVARADDHGFAEHLAVIPALIEPARFAILQAAAERLVGGERSWIPGHKRGATVSYADLHRVAPELVACYQSSALHALCSRVIGATIAPTPLRDQSSCSLLVYERPGDRIGWHYDHDFYAGRHFTALLPLINRHRKEARLSSARLEVRIGDAVRTVSTPPNTLVLFEGAKMLHQVTALGDDEHRVILSMTFTTDARCSPLQGVARRCKDVAYYGARALWT